MAVRSARAEYVSLAVVAGMLIVAVSLVRSHAESITGFIDDHGFQGVALYLVLNVIDAVIAPGATLPLIPIVARTWGHVPAALVTTLGWTMGSLIAFYIARRWGSPMVRKLTSMERLNRLRRYVPKHPFWTVVVLRLLMPMDVISYVLGLFTNMSWASYGLATALGLTPSAFVLAYIGRMPRAYDFITLGIGAAVIVWIILSTRRRGRDSATHQTANHSRSHRMA